MNPLGKIVDVILMAEKGLSAGNTAPYPEWKGMRVPVFVKDEYPNFYVCEVLPHRNTNVASFGDSRPYTVTIDKHDVKSGLFKFEERKCV